MICHKVKADDELNGLRGELLFCILFIAFYHLIVTDVDVMAVFLSTQLSGSFASRLDVGGGCKCPSVS
jgi:hypothetical protein